MVLGPSLICGMPLFLGRPGGVAAVARPSGSRHGYRSFQSEVLIVVVMDCNCPIFRERSGE